MESTQNINASAQHGKWFGRLVRGVTISTLAAFCVAASPAAKANLIEKYNLNMTAVTSAYNDGYNAPVITVTGQFLFDSTLGYITSVDLTLTGTSFEYGYSLPDGGVAINTVRTSNEDANDLSATSADGNYQIRFQFTNPLTSDGALDTVANQPWTDNGDAQFVDYYAYGDTTYHIGYFGVTGGAVPEPSSILLFGGSLLGLAFFIRRRTLGGSSAA
jgi:hypothetical protein